MLILCSLQQGNNQRNQSLIIRNSKEMLEALTMKEEENDVILIEKQVEKLKLPKADHIGKEPEEGNIEYKLKLVPSSIERLNHLITQMAWRIEEGGNEAIYQIGFDDYGVPIGLSKEEMEESLENFRKMAKLLNCEMQVFRTATGKEEGLTVCEVLVRKIPNDDFGPTEIKMAIIGNVDSGKSTFVGVLCKGGLDNGRGLSRTQVFRHRHEVENGRTSSISRQVMGFDGKGEVTNYGSWHSITVNEIVEKSSKIVTFVDLAGHEKYLKTTVFGLTSQIPDYATLALGANMGVQRMTKEHLGMTIALKIPLIIVVTKIDLSPPNVLKETIDNICKILKSKSAGKKRPFLVNNLDDVVVAARSLSAGIDVTGFVPIFQVSNVTGVGLDLYKSFLNLLPSQKQWEERKKDPTLLYIDDNFNVPGVGVIISGVLYCGVIEIGSNLLLGPDQEGKFRECTIKSIHNKAINVKRVAAGSSASFSLRLPHGEKLKRVDIRKGMVLIQKPDKGISGIACWEFTAEVLILHHPTTIQVGYQPVIHNRTVRQSAKIVSMSQDLVRTGDKSIVRFKFMSRPEVIHEGTTILFREGRTKGIGKVTAVYLVDY